MRAVCKSLVTVGILGAAILGATTIWIYPDVSSLRATIAASVNSTYPPHVVRAFLEAEDPHFLDSGRRQVGAATLIQQMVKSQTPPSRRISRQIKEIVVAAVIARTVRKSQVVNAYLDTVYLGSALGKSLYGVPIAARAYFGKQPRALTIGEAAMLAGIVRSPRAYSPIEHPEKAASRREDILAKMLTLNFITQKEFAAVHQPATAPPN